MDTNQIDSSSGSSVDASLRTVEDIATGRVQTPPPASLSTLPTELIRQTIESTVPHTFHSTTYDARQRTLFSLSSVSRQFRSIARPLRREIVLVTSVQEIHNWPIVTGNRDGEAGGKKVRCAVIWLCEFDKSEEDESEEIVEAALRKFSEVESLTLGNKSDLDLDLSFLSSFQNLSSLHISGHFAIKAPSSPLSNLQALSIYNIWSHLLSSLLSPSVVPNLRALALVRCGDTETLTDSDLKQLLPQLESISIDMGAVLDSETNFLHSKADATVVDINDSESPWFRLFAPELSVKHVRLCELFFDQPECREADLEFLGAFTICLEQNPTAPIRTIIVDSSLLPTLETPTLGRILFDRLQALCEKRKIDIVYEPLHRQLDMDFGVSSEFWARQRQSGKASREDVN